MAPWWLSVGPGRARPCAKDLCIELHPAAIHQYAIITLPLTLYALVRDTYTIHKMKDDEPHAWVRICTPNYPLDLNLNPTPDPGMIHPNRW